MLYGKNLKRPSSCKQICACALRIVPPACLVLHFELRCIRWITSAPFWTKIFDARGRSAKVTLVAGQRAAGEFHAHPVPAAAVPKTIIFHFGSFNTEFQPRRQRRRSVDATGAHIMRSRNPKEAVTRRAPTRRWIRDQFRKRLVEENPTAPSVRNCAGRESTPSMPPVPAPCQLPIVLEIERRSASLLFASSMFY